MKIKAYKSFFRSELLAFYDELEIESFFNLILEQFQNLTRLDLALDPNLFLTANEIENWNEILEKLKKEIPIQYILGKTNFFGLDFVVNHEVLIPRPETEELVDWILDGLKNNSKKNLAIIDIGTGSGCIAIALKKNLASATVFALDVSDASLKVAALNAQNNEVDVHFLHHNILDMESLEQKFDILVSNPPYVRNLEKHEIQKNVLDHEPHLALFVDDQDALIFYRKIGKLAKNHLKADGVLYFEINQYLGQETKNLIESIGFSNVVIRKDIYGNDRMIRAKV